MSIAIGIGIGGLIGFLLTTPFIRHPWYEFPTLWINLGILIGGVVSAVQYRALLTSLQDSQDKEKSDDAKA
ncbi:hypothetical protein [Microvirga zambiensis]|uniref:hypothetical protein n=1 Tax=Microvirga zambiensis TaxID=1402137 RepID=UPI00191E8DC3|nr:hypothetical protein [Microvirga zambiensis]